MSSVLLALTVLAALVLGRRQMAELREIGSSACPTDESAEVSIVVPARNEALTLPALLSSLRLLATPAGEVIVVDDSSDDATADVAREGGAVVVQAPAPPPDWTGKAWACHLGAATSRGRYLLFLDADTTLAPDALHRLVAMHAMSGGLVSVQPYHDVSRPYEQLSCYFNLVSLMGSGAFARRPAHRAMAFGPCLLTARDDYERVGGHAVVRAEILDDAGLAAAYVRAGRPVRCAVGGRTLRMRMYPAGPRQLMEGWTKNIASGAVQADHRSAAAAATWVAAHFAVAVGAVLAVARAVTGGATGHALIAPALWCLGWVVVSWQLRGLLRRVGSFHWLTWVAFPLPLLCFGSLFAWSVVLTYLRRSVRWRGRSVAMPDNRSKVDGT